jgi:hypothetical protein
MSLIPIEAGTIRKMLVSVSPSPACAAVLRQGLGVGSEVSDRSIRAGDSADARYFFYRDSAGADRGAIWIKNWNKEMRSADWGFCMGSDEPEQTGLEIVLAALDLAFGALRLRKLSCEVPANAHRLLYLYQEVDFDREGLLREQLVYETGPVDVIRFGMLEDEWEDRRTTLAQRLTQLKALAEEGSMAGRLRLSILSEADSWMNPYIYSLKTDWEAQGHTVEWRHEPSQVSSGDLCFCLSLGKLVNASTRSRFQHTLVVHESDLPRGKGWSPLTWQILAGVNRIPVTLFEAADHVDSGPIYAQHWLEFTGSELLDELRFGQALATRALCRWFVDQFPDSALHGREQQGEESIYRRRRPSDSQLDLDKSLSEQFNLLRVVDNDRYPGFFKKDGRLYRLRIEAEKPHE